VCAGPKEGLVSPRRETGDAGVYHWPRLRRPPGPAGGATTAAAAGQNRRWGGDGDCHDRGRRSGHTLRVAASQTRTSYVTNPGPADT
jgi:hypothetical protein